jgi:hypothetical protein
MMTKNQTTTEQANVAAKSASIGLRANGSTLMLLATLRADGSVVTTVTTRDADKRLTKGMTETHANMDTAKTHLATLAKKAEALGWQRGARAVAAKPDAFSKLPAAPKAAVA